jgi:hypothetical protein
MATYAKTIKFSVIGETVDPDAPFSANELRALEIAVRNLRDAHYTAKHRAETGTGTYATHGITAEWLEAIITKVNRLK